MDPLSILGTAVGFLPSLFGMGDDDAEQEKARREQERLQRRQMQQERLLAARGARGMNQPMDTGSMVGGGSVAPRNEALARLFK